jgi:hypothetical protein
MASEHQMAQSPGSLTLPDPPAVNLQVLSPSVGVNRPLMFPGLSSATTIKQLKEKIRQSLPLRPSDENQRLIYRGRALLHETDTLLDVIGSDVVSLLSFLIGLIHAKKKESTDLLMGL